MPDKRQKLPVEALTTPVSDEEVKYDFLLPLVVATCLVTPSLIILVLTKDSSGLAALAGSGIYRLIQVIMWLLVLVALASGVIYIRRTPSWVSRVLTVLVLLSLLSGCIYMQMP